jgi:hypothetical protein
MKVFLRRTNTNFYYAGNNDWTEDSRYARDFDQVEDAIQFHKDEKLAGVEVVLSYDDPFCNVALPLQPPH